MKKQQHQILGLLAVASAGFLSLGSAQAQNGGYNLNTDLVFFLQSNNSAFSTNIVTAAAGNISAIRDQRGTNGYSVLATSASLGAFLAQGSVYGANWFNSINLYGGAFGSRGTSTFVNNQSGTTGDSNRTVYFTQARGNTLNAGASASSPSTLVASVEVLNRSTSMNTVQNEFETVSHSSPFSEDAANSTVDDQAPIGGIQFANLAGVGNFLSSSFNFGGQSDVILVLDLYRMSPTSTFGNGTGELYDNDLAPLFLGNVVFKNTGEVGFLTVPEPTTATMIALAVGALALRNRRRLNA